MKSAAHLRPRSEHPDFIDDRKLSEKQQKYHKSANISTSHTDAHDRLDDISIHHKPHFHQITSVFKPSHKMVSVSPWSAWRPEASAPRRSRWRLVWCAAIDNEVLAPEAALGRLASRNIGRPRGAEAGLCVMSFCMFRPMLGSAGCKLAFPPKAASLKSGHGTWICAAQGHSAKTRH